MTCDNCGQQLSCGCQIQVTSDGKRCCVHCVGSYRQQQVIKQQQDSMSREAEQIIQNINTALLSGPR